MINIELNYNNSYKWIDNGKIYTIGYIFYNNELYTDAKLCDLISQFRKENIKQFINSIDGCFSIVIEYEDDILLISDIMRTFPVFYTVNEKGIYIKDNIMKYKNKKIKKENTIELSYCGYITGETTIFKNIYQLEGHQIVYINKNNKNIEKENYFDFKYNFEKNEDREEIKQLDELYDKIIKKMIKFLNGRKAVIPLSGGNDSRQLAYYLKQNNYNNILAYTYGSSSNSEIIVSKKIADFLGIEWHFIEYKNKSMQRKFNDKKFYKEMADYCGRGFSTPIIQEWEAISKLIENNIIDNNSVIISGYSGDFLAGTHIYDDLYKKEQIEFKELMNSIYEHQYQYADLPIHQTEINEKLKKTLDINDKAVMDKTEAINLFERFDFEERQIKYITNAIRTYDYQGLQWYLPFWDKELILKWLSIPLEKRYKIQLFKKYTNTIYKNLMEYAPIFKQESMKEIKLPFKIIKKVYRIIEIYRKGFLNFYGYFYFRTYLKYFLKTKSYHYNKIFATYYIDYVKKIINKEEV